MTITRAQVESCLTSTNVKAAIRLIRRGESWNDKAAPGSEYDERAYRVRYGGYDRETKRFLPPKYFDSFDDHPRVYEPTPTDISSAAGMAQFTATRFDDLRARYPGVLTGKFTPHEQECAVVLSMYDRGALDLVIDGNIAAFLPLLAKEWASLPNSPLDDGGRKMSLSDAYEEFRYWGGATAIVLDTATTDDRADQPAPIEDRSRQARPEDVERILSETQAFAATEPQREQPMAAPLLFLVPLLQSLISGFVDPLVRSKANNFLTKQGVDDASKQQIVGNLMNIVTNAASALTGVDGSAGVAAPLGVGGTGLGTVAPAATPPSSDPVVAVGAVKANAVALAQVEQQFADYMDQIAPIIDQIDRMQKGEWAASEESMRLASERAQGEPDGGQDRLLTWAILIIAGTTLLALGIALGVLIYADRPYGEVLALFAAGVGSVWAKFGTRYDYRYGSSRSSQAKDAAISQLSRR